MTMLQRDYHPPKAPLDILYEDEELLGVDKPPGLLSVPGRGSHLYDSVQSRLLDIYPDIRLIHRLDCDTSGIMLFAKTHHAQRHIGLQFEKRRVYKMYRAWVHGIPEETKGLVDLPIIVDWPNRPLQKICHETGRPAQTEWRRAKKKSSFSEMILRPLTGRSHQLRIHMRELGYPIVGDVFYAPTLFSQAPRLMLHAETLKIRHPNGGEWLEITAPLPLEFRKFYITDI